MEIILSSHRDTSFLASRVQLAEWDSNIFRSERRHQALPYLPIIRTAIAADIATITALTAKMLSVP